MSTTKVALLAAAAALYMASAFAQKTEDTLRIAVTNACAVLSNCGSPTDPDPASPEVRIETPAFYRMAYHFPLSSIPTVYVHSKDVKIKEDPFSAGQTFVSDYVWK